MEPSSSVQYQLPPSRTQPVAIEPSSVRKYHFPPTWTQPVRMEPYGGSPWVSER